ncbi:hypothetical protein GLS40_12025 [Pseudooceanicola sp. 216_PA32_1]|uniref:Uncharacterized protein n=1 Tax=Pseudooceanicola pacificus TaxID=2676438 RepID=A0A844WCK7_9RHOB|nr:hypothetical protein [Pseudooceanicola pacificus]MWB78758.1 hypothetical protein [Pseudooceanicola pacificus]
MLVRLLLCCALAWPAQAVAQGLQDKAQLVASERLRAYTLARGLTHGQGAFGAVRELKSLLQRQGHYLEPGHPALIYRDQALYPQIAHVPNMNGGFENRELELGGLLFRLRDDYAARGGVALGLTYAGQARLGWSPGRYVEARLQLGALHAPGPDLTRTDARVEICARNHIAGWTFADLCASQDRLWQELGEGRRNGLELGLHHLFETPGRFHEFSAYFGRTGEDFPDRSHIAFGLDTAWSRTATRISLRVQEPGPRQFGSDLTLAGDIRWLAGRRVVGLGLQASQSPESGFFGVRRQDIGFGVTGLVELRDNVVLTAGYAHIESTIDFFDSQSLQVNISFDLN